MRIYSNLKEAHGEIQRDLMEMGTLIHPSTYQDQYIGDKDEFITKELQGYCYCITSFGRLEIDFIDLGGNIGYVNQEVDDRLSDSWKNPGTSWKCRPEVWEQFLHKGKFSYTYNERIREQLPIIINELRTNPNTRQAIITMYDRHQDIANLGGKARIPCSLSYQFLIRPKGKGENRLDCIYTMRSCDLYTHFIYDVFMTMMMQEYVANSLGLEAGRFIHFIGSLHAYKKDYSKKEVF